MKSIKNKIFLLFLCISLAIGFLYIPTVKGIPDDIQYTFNDDILLSESVNFNETDSYNVRNHSISTQTYNATYSFTNDIDYIYNSSEIAELVSNVDFVNSAVIGGSSLVSITNNDGHDKVIKLNRIGSDTTVSHYSINQTNKVIEFWFKTLDSSLTSLVFDFFESTTQIMRFFTIGGSLRSQNQIPTWDVITNLLNDQWYHIKIVSNDSENTFDCYVNGILEANNLMFSADSIIGWNIFRLGITIDNIIYFDAIGHHGGIAEVIDDFSDDIIGQEPEGWTSANINEATTLIIANLDGRSKVLDLDDGITQQAIISREFNFSENQNIEFEFAKSKITFNSFAEVIFKEGSTSIVSLSFDFDDLIGVEGGIIKENFLTIDTFSKVRVVFNHILSTYNVFVDDILEASNFPYINDIINISIGINNLQFKTALEWDNYHLYIDNIFINSIFYTIGSNFIPYSIINTSIKQVDKYQFDYKLTNYTELRTAQGFEFGSWNVNNTEPELIKIISNPENEGMMVSIPAPAEASVSENLGIWKDFNTKGNTINISWQIYIFSWSTDKYIRSTIFSYNNISIANIVFDYKSLLFDGNVLFTHLARDNLYTLNLYINHNDGFSILRVKNSTEYIGTFYNPLSSLGKTGLGKVEFFLEINPTETILTAVDSIGAYMNFTSLCIDEFGYLNQPINSSTITLDGYTPFWSLHQYNLLTFNGLGNVSFFITSNFGGFKIFEMSNLIEYTGSRIINVYDTPIPIPAYPTAPEPNFRPTIPNATLRYYFFRNLIPYTLTIHGVKMDENSNRYHPHYTNNEVDTVLESFFYVDSGNRLRFSILFNDTNLEFITASFTINIVNTTDGIYGFRSNRNDVGIGTIQLSYTDDTSNIINIPIIETSINTIISQEKFLDTIIITLTDLDIDTTIGLMSGYVSQFRFIYAQNILVSIITTSLLQLIIPIIMIIIPSIAFSVKVGKIAILPMFITMSLICFITNIIPLWLFFVIAFASSFFIFLEKNLREI